MYLKRIIPILLLILISSCSGDEKVVDMKQEVQHDDYFYSVEGYYKADEIAKEKASGTFYVVTFKVTNRAKRVDHPWENSIAYVVDEKGKEYHNLPEKQKLLNTIIPFNLKDRHITKAGETETTVFVFDIPNNVKQPYLKYNGEFLMGDMFDGNQFKHARIKLF